jgi:hypothetical protein
MRRIAQKATSPQRATKVLALTGKNGPAEKWAYAKRRLWKKQRGELSTRTAPRTGGREASPLRVELPSVVGGKPLAERVCRNGTSGGQGPLQRVVIGRRILMRLAMRAGYGDRVAGSHPAPLPQRGGRSRPQWGRSFPLPTPTRGPTNTGPTKKLGPNNPTDTRLLGGATLGEPRTPNPALGTRSKLRWLRSRPQWDKQKLTGRRNGHISSL